MWRLLGPSATRITMSSPATTVATTTTTTITATTTTIATTAAATTATRMTTNVDPSGPCVRVFPLHYNTFSNSQLRRIDDASAKSANHIARLASSKFSLWHRFDPLVVKRKAVDRVPNDGAGDDDVTTVTCDVCWVSLQQIHASDLWPGATEAVLNSTADSGSGLPAPEQSPQPQRQFAVLLGFDQDSAAHFAVPVSSKENYQQLLSSPSSSSSSASTSSPEFANLRSCLPFLSSHEAAVLAQGRALLEWHFNHLYCGKCGSATVAIEAGLKRKCVNEKQPASGQAVATAAATDSKVRGGKSGAGSGCGQSLYPRTDPVAIVGVISHDGKRMLLGRKPEHPKGIYSCVAGFVSPGETIEEAVRREVKEETGVVVSKVAYFSSQPWPFGSQLMIGCFAWTASESDEKVDRSGDDELEDAKWCSFEEISAAVTRGRDPTSFFSSSEFRVPPPLAIAHKLVSAWLHGIPAQMLQSQSSSSSSSPSPSSSSL